MTEPVDLTDPYRLFRRLIVALLGLSVLLVGVAMLALPGPAMIVIPAGLGILAIEFEWARRWLRKLKATYAEIAEQVGIASEDETPPEAPQPNTSESKSTPIGQ